jgi:uncharacterized protein YecT (DUF1311 family)
VKLRIPAAVVLSMTAALARAAAGPDDPFKNLDCRKAVVQMELNACANREFETWDARLNALYRTLLKNADAKDLALLKTAERNWLSYRDSECAFETAGSEGGSIQPMEYSNCLTAKTRARIAELKSQGN